MTKLNALKVKNANYPTGRKGNYLLGDGNNLYLQIKPEGSKSWAFRYRINGKSHTIGLGSADTDKGGISLAQARELAAEQHSKLRRGINPIYETPSKKKGNEQRNDFKDLSIEYIEIHKSGWKNKKHIQQWQNTLETYAFPVIADIPVADITSDHLVKILRPIWEEKNETATRVRSRIENILDYAKVKKLRTGENPAAWKGNLKFLLPNISKEKRTEHYPALPWERMPEFMTALKTKDTPSTEALQFLILTGARSGEVRNAVWSEINLENAVWTIPADRMKTQVEHKVPLSKSALGLLNGLTPLARGADSYVFPSVKAGKAMSDMTLLQLVRRMRDASNKPWCDANGRIIVVHGFRSTIRDWIEEIVQPQNKLGEMVLAHKNPNKVESAYLRTTLFNSRIQIMQKWDDYCHSDLSKNT